MHDHNSSNQCKPSSTYCYHNLYKKLKCLIVSNAIWLTSVTQGFSSIPYKNHIMDYLNILLYTICVSFGTDTKCTSNRLIQLWSHIYMRNKDIKANITENNMHWKIKEYILINFVDMMNSIYIYVEILNTIVNLPLSSFFTSGSSAFSAAVSMSWLILLSAVSLIKYIKLPWELIMLLTN